jgi:2-C-methyl-D-erythritol 2,4-cyclodiphosphate synthase
LRRVREIINEKGYEVVNVDSVLMMEDPKVSEHRGMMCEKIGQALGIDESQVGVKATTTEKLGFVGRGEGASAQAVALLRKQSKESPPLAS